jgi:hypothetical protein
MAISYQIHFVTYSDGKKNVTYLIPSMIWKLVYIIYVVTYLDFPFVEDTLKDYLRDVFKRVKAWYGGSFMESHSYFYRVPFV